MEYNKEKREIVLNKNLSKLDKLVLKFVKILEKSAEYVIISGYVSILLGRSRATEDVDFFIMPISFETFSTLYENLKKNGFWCLNAEKPFEIFRYLEEDLAIRFAEENKSIPNFKIKFKKKDDNPFEDTITILLPDNQNLRISSLERQIAYKRYYLKSDKDLEDALHVEEIFKEKLDYNKILRFKQIINRKLNT
jgi:hypothetical protein